MTVPEHCISGRPVVTHLTSTRFRDVILYKQRIWAGIIWKDEKVPLRRYPLSSRQRTTRTMRFRMYLSPAKIGKIPVTPLTIRWSYSTQKAKRSNNSGGITWNSIFFLSDLEYKIRLLCINEPLAGSGNSKVDCRIPRKKVISNPNGQKTTFFFIWKPAKKHRFVS